MADSLKMEIPEFIPRSQKGRNLELVKETEVPEEKSYSQREAKLQAKEKELQEVLSYLTTAVKIVGSRGLVFLSALVSAGLFGWAAFDPTWQKISSACLFSVIVFLPALYADFQRS